MVESYQTYLIFYGLTSLPNYVASIAFELFTEEDTTALPDNHEQDLRVRLFVQERD